MRVRRLCSIFFLALGLLGCGAPAWKQLPHDRRFQTVPPGLAHPRPRAEEISEWWDALSQSVARPLAQGSSPGYWLGRLLGPPPALDVNAFGQVLDSGWFTNRLGRRALDVAALARGPNTGEGPADGPLRVLDAKLSGATPGLVVEDVRGVQYIVKFDPPAYPELASGAELIATKLLWAAGYHVPENHLGVLELGRLVLDPAARTSGGYGETLPLTQAGLLALLRNVNPYPDGRIRALFSRRLAGRPLGPFRYRGVRPDDPNDRIPHERRRSLRGLWMFQAWLHNVDTRAANSLDVWVESPEDPGLGEVRHHLIDFGDALGAAGVRPKFIGEGYQYALDWPQIGAAVFSLGLYYPFWLPVERSPFRSVGVYESQIFRPEDWRPNLPNPAFDEADALDEYWAASILARFTPDHLAAAVGAARYTEPGAAAWVLRVLTERQYALVRHGFARVLPLDDPRVTGWRVSLTDLEVYAMARGAEVCEYEWSLRWNRTGAADVELGAGRAGTPTAELGPAIAAARAAHGEALAADPFVTLRWRRRVAGRVGSALELHLRLLPERLLPVGLEREVD